jgi:hypothetical protein
VPSNPSSYFEDLTPYEYLGRREADTYNVGWLDNRHPFPRGEMGKAAWKSLLRLCINPLNRTRGWQGCPLCDEPVPIRIRVDGEQFALGDGEIRVAGTNHKWYAAPNLICHYVEKHQYKPPEEFQRALLEAESK